MRLKTVLMMSLLCGQFVGGQLSGCARMPTQQPAAEAIEDGVMTARIKERLTEDPLTKVHVIKVETFRGTVELSGFVETDQVRTRALALAKDVDGVKRVRDAMDVRSAYR